jgi:succinate-semialdehyde dehydrogenase / glutarate-semialdehyde dehydrogenase
MSATMRDFARRSRLLRSQLPIAGAWQDAASGRTIAVDDPFTGEIIGEVPDAGGVETEAAIASAQAAFAPWAALPPIERGRILRRWLDAIMAHKDEIAAIITLENGKPLQEARGEIDYGAGFVEFYAEEASRARGETIAASAAGRRLRTEREPIGVCAAITPWNFPFAMLTRKVAPALAAGCTIVAKPAQQTPLSALALAVLGEEAGMPPGVFNIVTGDAAAIGRVLTASPVVRKLSFTGSTRVGALLMEACAGTIKRVSMELGGNAPLLIFDDADLDTAIETAIVAKFRNSGQSCIAANRIYVQSGIHDRFIAAFAERVAALRLGDGFDEATHIGPLIEPSAVAKCNAHLDDALARGARLLHGGRGEGRMMPPTLVSNVAPDVLLSREESFGPLAAVMRFETVAEAIRLANDTPFGLAAYLCSSDPGTIDRVSRAIESGMVGINTGFISTAWAPFGGVKQSGVGREGSHLGMDEYLNVKYLCQAGL